MKTYRIKVDGKVYEMEIALTGEAVCSEPESDVKVGERLSYSMKTKAEEKTGETKR